MFENKSFEEIALIIETTPDFMGGVAPISAKTAFILSIAKESIMSFAPITIEGNGVYLDPETPRTNMKRQFVQFFVSQHPTQHPHTLKSGKVYTAPSSTLHYGQVVELMNQFFGISPTPLNESKLTTSEKYSLSRILKHAEDGD